MIHTNENHLHSMCSTIPCWSSINLELGIGFEDLNNGYSAQMAGLSTGCILFVPLSFRYGLRPVWLVTSLLTVLTALWWANMQSRWEWYVINLISGLAGAPNEALMPSVVSISVIRTYYHTEQSLRSNICFMSVISV
jgi:MFS family permease